MSKSHVDYKELIEKQLDKVGRANGTKLPVSNDDADADWQEYAISKMIADYAKRRHDKARAAVMQRVSTEQLGKSIVHDSTFVIALAEVRNGQSRIDRNKLTSAIVQQFQCTFEEAVAVIDTGTVRGDPVAVLSVTLKQ